MIQNIKKEEYSTSDQILIYKNEQLEDYKTIQDYSIESNSILLYHHIVHIQKNLNFKKPNGEIITIEADPSNKMEQIRNNICKMIHHKPENVKIFYLGDEINYNDTVEKITFSMITEYYFYVVFVTSSENKIVIVKKNDVCFIPIEINDRCTVKNIKEMIFQCEKKSVDEQKIVFNGNTLKDDCSMNDFLISNHSKNDLNLIFNHSMKINEKFERRLFPSFCIT